MNLWILNHYAITPDLPGGTRHFDLGRELVKRGYQVAIFASSFHHYQHQDMKLRPDENWKVEHVEGVQFIWLRTFPYRRNDWRRVLNMISYMLRAWWLGYRVLKPVPEIGKPDVVIGSSVHLLAVLAAYWVAQHHQAKFIMEVRDLWPQTFIDMGVLNNSHPLARILRTLERFLYKRSERIITLMPLGGSYISAQGTDGKKIVWIPNGVDLARFSDVKTKEKENGQFQVMYLGAHGQANALDVLLNAAKIVQDRGYQAIRFILVGDGPEKPRLVELAKELALENVEFCAPVPKSDVPEVLKEAEAAVFVLQDLPVYRYGVSLNKSFDYLGAAKPLILAGNPVNNPVEKAHCGLQVPPRNPAALAEAVIQLYEMAPEERRAMGERGREYVRKYHDWAILANKIEECIEEVCS